MDTFLSEAAPGQLFCRADIQGKEGKEGRVNRMRKRWMAAAAVLLVLVGLLALGISEAFLKPYAGTGDSAVSMQEDQAQKLLTARKRKKTQAPSATPTPDWRTGQDWTPTPIPEGPIIDPQSIADYVFAHGELPENFITKKEARALGWDSSWNYVSDVAPGMSIGGDWFGNYEEKLPVVLGREYREADCWYTGGPRRAERIIYSNDGRVWYTEDHYNTFMELFPTGFGEDEIAP